MASGPPPDLQLGLLGEILGGQASEVVFRTAAGVSWMACHENEVPLGNSCSRLRREPVLSEVADRWPR